MAQQEIERSALRLGAAGAATATTAVNGAAQDMAGFEGVLIFARIATANAGNFLKGQQGELADSSDMADLAGTKVVAAANDQVVCLDINRPRERYVRGVIIRAGATTVTGDMYYLPYNATNKPTVNQITNILISLAVKSPVEGAP